MAKTRKLRRVVWKIDVALCLFALAAVIQALR